MKLFFENISACERISRSFPLESSVEQALEIFENLPENDGSSMGFIDSNNILIEFQKFNQFLWLIEIPVFSENGSFQAVCNRHQCKRVIKQLFQGVDPFLTCDFEFQSNL